MPTASVRGLIAAALLALLAAPGFAGVPDPSQSVLDGDLMLGNARGLPLVPGLSSVRPTLFDGYRVVVRDVLGLPVPGATVTLLLLGSGLRPHATQSGAQSAFCPSAKLYQLTDASGTAVFFPATVGLNSSPGPNVQIRADDVLLGVVRFRSVDLVPAVAGTGSAVDVGDLNEFRLRFLNLAPYSNLDPACDFATEGASAGVVDVADLNVFRTEFLCGLGGAPSPCSQTQCP